jgi:signal transduction histidine kinase
MRNPFARRIRLAFTVGIAFLLLCTALSLITLHRAGDKAKWRQHTYIVIQKLELLLSVMKDAETGARGYIIAGDERTLEPYINSEKACSKLLQDVATLTSDNAQQKPSVAALDQIIHKEFDVLKTYVDLTKAGKDVGPAQIEQGKAVMDQARHIVKQMKNREYRLLAQRNADWEHTWGLLPWLIVLLTLGSVFSTTYFCRALQINYFEKVKFRRKLQQQAIIIANRIEVIQHVTAQVAGGDYAVRLSDKESDRLGILSTDIDKMTASLEHSFSTLNEWMRRKDEFINITAHEFKTPLTSIKAVLQFIARVKFTDNESRKVYPFVEKANHQVNRLTEILKDLLEVSKINTSQLVLQKSVFMLNQAIANCMEGAQATYKSHQMAFTGEDTQIQADRFKIEQVITNLITNAAKYSGPNTAITITSERDGAFVRVSVTDQGIGIPADKLPFVFERYFRVEETSQNYSGMGLGLYICKGIIEQHGGQIGAGSTLGKGTTFWFTLPVTKDSVAAVDSI